MKNFTFGFEAITQQTPLWAKWLFRITFIITTVAAFWVAGTALIAQPIKVEIMLGLKALDGIVFGFSKLFGEKINTHEQP